MQRRRGRRPGRADPRLDPLAGRRTVAIAQPVDVADAEAVPEQGLARTDDHAPGFGLDPRDVQRLVRGDAETPALADGEPGDAAVAAHYGAMAVNDVAGLEGLGTQGLDDPGIAAVGDEADVLAVGLLGDGEPEAAGDAAGLGLG